MHAYLRYHSRIHEVMGIAREPTSWYMLPQGAPAQINPHEEPQAWRGVLLANYNACSGLDSTLCADGPRGFAARGFVAKAGGGTGEPAEANHVSG
jgi:hypothetical protein